MSHKIIIPNSHPHHQVLSDMVSTFASQHDIQSVFFSFYSYTQQAFIIIQLSSSHAPKLIQQSKWINKAREQYNCLIIILGMVDLRRHLKLGSLFINQHCNASTLIYKQKDHEFSYPEFSKQLKKYKQLKEEYYRSHDLLSTEIRRANNNSALSMAYHLYITLFELHLFHLEFLCLGQYFYKDTLNERFLRLENYLPEIKSLMLKKTGISYFVIEALHSAKTADEEQDPMILENEFEESIAKIEGQLYHLVERVFKETKKSVMAVDTTVTICTDSQEISPYESIISILTKHYVIDEIFLYHQEEETCKDAKTSILYLLLISEHISNQNLLEMTQIISQKTQGRFSIVPISHSKVWIQEHLWEYQAFFQKIMADENSIYKADVSSIIHWHAEPSNYHVDIELYAQFCFDLYHNYQLIRAHEEQKNHEGFGLLLSGLIYRTCSVLLFAQLGYKPNLINIRILWKLCAYAEPKVKQLNYLIQKLPFDFFELLNPSKNIHKNYCLIDEKAMLILDDLTQNLIDLLNEHFKT